MKKRAKKVSRPGRPRKFEARRSFLVSLREEDVEWLDYTATKSGISRAELVMALMGMVRNLEATGHLLVAQQGLVWFRAIVDLLELWGQAVNADVWRFEFQLRRSVLKSMGLNSLADWMQSRGTLWKYLTGEWFSLRRHDDENASRRTVHPFWDQVQSCAARFDAADAAIQRRRAIPSFDVSHLAKQIAGGVVGLGARRGVIHLEEAKKLVGDLLDEEFHDRDFAVACQQKAIQLGLDTQKEAA